MCCGRDEIPLTEIVMAYPVGRESVMARGEELFPLYTQVYGMAIRIGHYGEATNTTPAMVPQAVLDELASDKTLGSSPLAPKAEDTEPPLDEGDGEDDDAPKQPRRRERRGKGR